MVKTILKISIILLSVISFTDNYAQTKDCNYVVKYYDNGTKKEEGCLTNDKKEGLWKEYFVNSSHVNGGYIYESIYKDNIKNGPYTIYYITGEIRGKGFYKNNASVDTFITYTKSGELISKCFLVPTTGKDSKVTWRKYYDPNAKPDGTFETKDGKTYMWQLGEMTEFKFKK